MHHVTKLSLAVLALTVLLCSQTTNADKAKRQTHALVEIDDPDEMLDALTRLVRAILRSTAYDAQEKRNIDLGFSRGFSGSQAAKHLMGLAAANFAGGPGRRRRSPEPMDSPLEE